MVLEQALAAAESLHALLLLIRASASTAVSDDAAALAAFERVRVLGAEVAAAVASSSPPPTNTAPQPPPSSLAALPRVLQLRVGSYLGCASVARLEAAGRAARDLAGALVAQQARERFGASCRGGAPPQRRLVPSAACVRESWGRVARFMAARHAATCSSSPSSLVAAGYSGGSYQGSSDDDDGGGGSGGGGRRRGGAGGTTLLVGQSGSLFSWGDTDRALGQGLLGLGQSTEQPRAIGPPLRALRIVACATSGNHSLALSDGGAVYAWGSGASGALGLGTRDDASEPRPVLAFPLRSPVRVVAAGALHSAAVCAGGELFTWGDADDGKLGHGDIGINGPLGIVNRPLMSPRRVRRLAHGGAMVRMVGVACGSYHTAAFDEGGALYTFGSGSLGALGCLPLRSHRPVRVTVGLPAGVAVVGVAAGQDHTLVLMAGDGGVFSCGDGTCCGHGEPADGSSEGVWVPREIEALAGQRCVVAAAGCGYSALVTAGGALYTFGSGRHGVLGHGDEEPQPLPRAVAALGTGVVDVACGGTHTVVVVAAGPGDEDGGGGRGGDAGGDAEIGGHWVYTFGCCALGRPELYDSDGEEVAQAVPKLVLRHPQRRALSVPQQPPSPPPLPPPAAPCGGVLANAVEWAIS
jgi:alpha-tubulin suppressor-like RCC1 family protein